MNQNSVLRWRQCWRTNGIAESTQTGVRNGGSVKNLRQQWKHYKFASATLKPFANGEALRLQGYNCALKKSGLTRWAGKQVSISQKPLPSLSWNCNVNAARPSRVLRKMTLSVVVSVLWTADQSCLETSLPFRCNFPCLSVCLSPYLSMSVTACPLGASVLVCLGLSVPVCQIVCLIASLSSAVLFCPSVSLDASLPVRLSQCISPSLITISYWKGSVL